MQQSLDQKPNLQQCLSNKPFSKKNKKCSLSSVQKQTLFPLLRRLSEEAEMEAYQGWGLLLVSTLSAVSKHGVVVMLGLVEMSKVSYPLRVINSL
jgi:hypothetical protein